MNSNELKYTVANAPISRRDKSLVGKVYTGLEHAVGMQQHKSNKNLAYLRHVVFCPINVSTELKSLRDYWRILPCHSSLFDCFSLDIRNDALKQKSPLGDLGALNFKR